MKILILNSLGFEAGGVETGIIEIKKSLQEKRHRVKILTSDYTNGEKLFSDFTFKYYHNNKYLKIFLRLFNPFSYFELKRALHDYQPDIVHVNRMDFLSPSVLLLLKKYHTIMTIHGPEDFIKSLLIWFMPYFYFKNYKISKDNLNFIGKLHYFYHIYIQSIMYKIALKNINLFIVPSNYVQSVIGEELKPVVTIYNGIKLLHPKRNTNKTYILAYIGRIDMLKGIDFIIKAMPKILRKFPKCKLLIIGDGNYKEKLIALAVKLSVQDKVLFLPWQTSENVEKYYQSADIVIMPSIWTEAFGKVGVEAMSVGTPVIATRVGGIPEWLDDGKTGYLVKPKSSDEIAEKVIMLFSDKKLLKTMGKNARVKSKNFNIEKHVNDLEHIYNQLLNKK